MKKAEGVIFIEQCFRNIQHDKDVDKNIRLIENSIKREFDIKTSITIIENDKQFFGMCVYPAISEMEMLTTALLNNSDENKKLNFKNLEKIHADIMDRSTIMIEVDSILLYDHNLNATAGEITAILLHEIGHIIASNSTVNKMRRAKEYMLTKFDSQTRRVVKEVPASKHLFNLVTLQIFSHQLNIQLIKEKEADEVARKVGYGDELVSILNKLIANGKGSEIRKSDKEIEKDVEMSIDWVVTNIKELEYRKNRLDKSFKLLKLSSPSKHYRNCVDAIHRHVYKDIDTNNRKPELVAEAFMLSALRNKKMKAPSGAVDSSGRVRKLLSRDLDIYRAELERVNSVDEKIFLLERLHDLMDNAEYALYMLKEDPRRVMQSETTILQYIESLQDLIRQCSERKTCRDKYGLYIKYPADYEG